MRKRRPPRPTRYCVKNAGPGEVRRTHNATASIGTPKSTITSSATDRSTSRLDQERVQALAEGLSRRASLARTPCRTGGNAEIGKGGTETTLDSNARLESCMK